MNLLLKLGAGAMVAAFVVGCAHHDKKAPAPAATVSGNVSYAGVLPPDTSLTVNLVENTSLSGSVSVLATATLNFQNGSPVPYSVVYNPAEVEDDNRYSLVARATRPDGRVILHSNAYMVLTKGNPKTGVNLELVPFASNP